jgi:hypothetical protein
MAGMQPAEEFSTLVHEIAHLAAQRFMWRSPRDAHRDSPFGAAKHHIT